MHSCKPLLFAVILCLVSAKIVFSQSGSVAGKVVNKINNEPIPFANVVIQGTSTGAVTDFEGNYSIKNLEPGLYNFEASFVGYESSIAYEIELTNAKTVALDFALNEQATSLNEVEVKASPFSKRDESPLSLRTIGVAEIQRAPGGNRDISRVIQNLPGVATTPSFRNDIIIRGGAPNENRFYLDGVEVPNINHFATQGSSGGPVGMINVNLISEVDYYAGAFPANRGNSLSSLFEFRQKNANKEKILTNFMLGSSDVALTLDGPIGKGGKTDFIFSVRRSYLQFLFQALRLPFLPTYTDNQFRVTHNFNQKNKLSLIGLGALDNFRINTSVNDGLEDEELIKRNQYILGNIPKSEQWNYTIGAVYKHFGDNSYQTLVVSRNHLNNVASKYIDNDESIEENLLLKYNSNEIENKLRFEHNTKWNGIDINAGINYEYAQYDNSTVNNQVFVNGQNVAVFFNSELALSKYGAFVQLNRDFLDRRLTTSLGLRTDFNDYSSDMSNPLEMLSPRVSLSYQLADKLSVNFNTGRYYQLPAYTILGYRDFAGELVNKNNGVRYIGVDHVVAGLEFNSSFSSKITIEGFYKGYFNYPINLTDSISLANLGADFGVIGNEPVESASNGRAYGMEVLAQQKLSNKLYGILAYTLVRSEFAGFDGVYTPSAWDFGHIINITAGRKFNKNWEIGARFRYSGGAPYTPYDFNLSGLRSVWDVTGIGLINYGALNSQRLASNNQLDIRVDKRYYFDKWSLNIYLDIQNIYNAPVPQAPYVDVVRNELGKPIVDPNDPSRYLLETITNNSGTVLPSVGFMIEF